MDRNTARDLFLSTVNFKPKEKDLPTPYLTLPDGTTLDGQLKMVGITGKQSIDLEEQASDQTIEPDGTAKNKLNFRKFTGLAIQAVVRMRDTGENWLNVADVLGPKGDGNSELLEKDSDIFKQLSTAVLTFIGKKPAKLEEKKDNSGATQSDSSSSSLPPDSAEPSENSSTESTPQS